MTATLAVDVCEGRIDRIAADVLVAPFFESHRPLRGPAAHVDWRLCGLLSEELQAGRIRGTRGEATLLVSAGRLQTPCVMAFGLGAKPGFSERDLADLSREVVGRAVALRAGRAAIALPDELVLGFPVELASAAVVRGAALALQERPAALHLRLVCGSRGRDAERGVRQAAAGAGVPVRLGTVAGSGSAPGGSPPVLPRARRAAPDALPPG